MEGMQSFHGHEIVKTENLGQTMASLAAAIVKKISKNA